LLDNYYHPTTSPLEKKFEKIRIVLREKKKKMKTILKRLHVKIQQQPSKEKKIGLSVFDKGSIQRSLKAKKKNPQKMTKTTKKFKSLYEWLAVLILCWHI